MSPHGLPNAPEHHLGDLGNVQVDGRGEAELELLVADANLKPGHPLSFLQRSIDLHERSDRGDGETGEAGKTIACAAIADGAPDDDG